MDKPIPAEHFVALLAANIDNMQMSDMSFRAFVRGSLGIVQSADPSLVSVSAQAPDASMAQR